MTVQEFRVTSLGESRFDSPLRRGGGVTFVHDARWVRLIDGSQPDGEQTVGDIERRFERAGPRARIFFRPADTTVAIVTCGGLSPGLNNVIRSAYLELSYNYEVARILGIPEGFRGLDPASELAPVTLTRRGVQNIHNLGGTLLGSSRGAHDPAVMVDYLETVGVDALLCVGGDGTLRGAHAIAEEIARRGLKKAVIGIPKTIDNDIPHVWMSFGYATAIEKAAEVLRAAHVEAIGAPNGMGLVKLMGRDAGYIAAGAAVASQDANFVLVPEVRFPLEGYHGLLAALERRITDRGHALVVVAEGAGQHLFEQGSQERDASGNPRPLDIGVFLRDRIRAHFRSREITLNLKYIDPSYLIRSVPANAWDRVLSDRMARSGVHAAMAGRTDMLIGFEQSLLMHVPIAAVAAQKKPMPVTSDLWRGVLSTTGQPRW